VQINDYGIVKCKMCARFCSLSYGHQRINDVSLIRNSTLCRWDELYKDMLGSTIGLFKVRFSNENNNKKKIVSCLC